MKKQLAFIQIVMFSVLFLSLTFSPTAILFAYFANGHDFCVKAYNYNRSTKALGAVIDTEVFSTDEAEFTIQLVHFVRHDSHSSQPQ